MESLDRLWQMCGDVPAFLINRESKKKSPTACHKYRDRKWENLAKFENGQKNKGQNPTTPCHDLREHSVNVAELTNRWTNSWALAKPCARPRNSSVGVQGFIFMQIQHGMQRKLVPFGKSCHSLKSVVCAVVGVNTANWSRACHSLWMWHTHIWRSYTCATTSLSLLLAAV